MFFTNVAAYDDKLFVSTSCGLVLKVSALDFHLDFAKKVFSSDISAMIYGDQQRCLYIGGMNNLLKIYQFD